MRQLKIVPKGRQTTDLGLISKFGLALGVKRIPIIYTLCLKEDPFHTVSFSFISFSTAAVAGRLATRDA